MYRRFDIGWLKHVDFLLIDFLALALSCAISYCIRFGFGISGDFDFYVQIFILTLILNICVSIMNESHHDILKRGFLIEVGASIKHVALIMVILIFYLFLIKQNAMLSRLFFICYVLISGVLVFTFRSIHKLVLKNRRAHNPEKLYSMLILASKTNIEEVLPNVQSAGNRIVGICLIDDDRTGGTIQEVPVVAGIDTLLDYIKENVVDGLFVGLPESIPVPGSILDICISMGVSTHIGVMKSESGGDSQILESIGKYTVLTRSISIVTAKQMFVKRVMDICVGLVGVVVTAICFLFVAPAIYIKSPGPIFFSQVRVGRNGRKFKIYKFRSMYMDAEERKKELMAQNKIADGLMFKIDEDPRIIKGVGQFIRKYSIDELPQMWNVLKGDMSLIGTRPPTVEEYEKYDYHHKIRLAIKPGITGMWQVSGRSNITDFEKVVALDASYITNWSLGLDLKIFLKTIKIVLNQDGAV